MKKKGFSQRGLGSYVPAHLNDSPFFEDSISQSPDSVKSENLVDTAYMDAVNGDGVFFPEKIESADPVTYDDNGNVIPLSERFNSDKKDIRYSHKSGDIDNYTEEMYNTFGWASRETSPENKNNLNANLSKGESINEQESQDSGILEGRVLSTVSESKNNQRQRSNDTQNVRTVVGRNREAGRYAFGSEDYRRISSGYLGQSNIVSPYHYKRLVEGILRNWKGKLADRDSSNRRLPEEIKERFKDTVLKNEDGELLAEKKTRRKPSKN